MISRQIMTLILLLLCGIYHGPSYLAKHGLADFGDFLVILLIQAKENAINGYKKYPDRLPKGSVKKIQEFLIVFPVLSHRQQEVLSKFISNEDVDAFFRENFGDDYQNLITKYEASFRSILPTLFRNGLEVSPHARGAKGESALPPNYHGRYTCSNARWVVVKTIYSILRAKAADVSKSVESAESSKSSQMIKFAISMMQDYRNNRIFQLYIETMVHIERTGGYADCFNVADQEFRNIIIADHADYEAWLNLHAEFRKTAGYSFPLYPKDWDPKLIAWIMNAFQNYDYLVEKGGSSSSC